MIQSRTPKWQTKSQMPNDWRLLFAVWIGIVIPMLAFGIAYTRTSAPGTDGNTEIVQANAAFALNAAPSANLVRNILVTNGMNPNAVTTTGLPQQWDAAAIAPRNANIIVIAAQRDLAISRDQGRTWIRLVNTLPAAAHALAIDEANELVLYANLDRLGMYGSDDGGLSWSPLATRQ